MDKEYNTKWYDNLETSEWIGQFKSLPLYSEERNKILEEYTDQSLHCYSDSIWQIEWLPWPVMYKLLQIFADWDFMIRYSVKEESFDRQSFVNGYQTARMFELLEQGYVEAFRSKICDDGRVYIMFLIAEGDHGDEDGFGVEPDIWAEGMIDSDGIISVPFYLRLENMKLIKRIY